MSISYKQIRRANSQCVDCGKPIKVGASRCVDHMLIHNMTVKINRAKKRLAGVVCLQCNKPWDHSAGFKTCEECRAKQLAAKNKLKATGRCITCSGIVVTGYTKCAACLENNYERERRKRAKNAKDPSKCVRCSGPKVDMTKKTCEKCRKLNRESHFRSKEKLNMNHDKKVL